MIGIGVDVCKQCQLKLEIVNHISIPPPWKSLSITSSQPVERSSSASSITVNLEKC